MLVVLVHVRAVKMAVFAGNREIGIALFVGPMAVIAIILNAIAIPVHLLRLVGIVIAE